MTPFYPYFATMAIATLTAAVRTRQLRPSTQQSSTPRKRHEHTAMLLLTIYLALNLLTEVIAFQLAKHHSYNHYIHALGILLCQALLCASLCYFSQLNRILLTYSLLLQPLYLYTYIQNQYWLPQSIVPQPHFAAHTALMAIASILFCGIQFYQYIQQSQQPQQHHHQQHSYLGLALICLLYHLYLQLANSFQLSETLARLLHINDLTIYLMIPSIFYLALTLYLMRYQTKKKHTKPQPAQPTSPER